MEQTANAVIMYPDDNVVTAIADLTKDEIVRFKQKNNWIELKLLEDISFGHKLAISTIKDQMPVIKYGETIGIANKEIQPGQHVHVHNVDSVRGKGK